MVTGVVGLARAGGRPVRRRLSRATMPLTVPEPQLPLQTTATTQLTGCTATAKARARA